jgi:hypothetical protein
LPSSTISSRVGPSTRTSGYMLCATNTYMCCHTMPP